MDIELVRTFRFEAAHSLVGVDEGHKCSRMHGHSYRVDIHVCGDVDPLSGMVLDFAKITEAAEPILDGLDHRCLNDIDGLANPTSELLSKFLWDRIKPALPQMSAITVWESDISRCIYRGED